MTTTREVDGERIASGLYRHIRSGGIYTVLGLVRHHETGKAMVIYYSHAHGTVNTRPLHGFVGPKGCSDPDGFAERFEFITSEFMMGPHPATLMETEASLLTLLGVAVDPTELWTSQTLLRNFSIFEAALAGVGKPLAGEPKTLNLAGTDDRLAAAVLALERALEVLRKEQFERAKPRQ